MKHLSYPDHEQIAPDCVQLWIVFCNEGAVAAFDDESRARAFHSRRVDQATRYATPAAIEKNPVGPFLWTIQTVPYNVGVVK